MSLIKKLAGETAIYGISNILNRLLNYIIITPYLTYVFNEDQGEYGDHGMMYAFAAFLMVIFTYGMETAFFRFANKKGELDRVFSTASISLISSTILLSTFFLLMAPQIAAWLLNPALYIRYFILIVAFDALAAIPFARLRLENRPIRFAFYKAINIVINGGMILFFLELCPYLTEQGSDWASQIYDPERKLEYVFLANLMASAATILLLLPMYFKIKLAFDAALWKKMTWYAAPLIIVGIAGMINQLSDRILIPQLMTGTLESNKEQLGIYNAAVKIAVLINLFTQAFKFAAEPFFFRHSDRVDSRQIYAQVGQAFAFVGSLAFLGLLLYLDVFQFIIASNFREGLVIAPIMILAYLFLGLYFNFSIWFKITDQTYIGAIISVCGAVISLSLNFTLIPQLGYLGAAWASFSCFLFMAVVSYLVGLRYYPIPYPIGKMILYITLAVAVWWLSEQLRPALLGSFGLIFLVNTLLLIGYLLAIAMLERPLLRKILKRN